MNKSHAATMTEMKVKTRQIKELVLQSEEDIIILQESLDKLNEKIKMIRSSSRSRRASPTPT